MKRILSHTAEITGEAPLVRVAVTLALPAMGMMYLIASFNFIDTEFAGQLGAAALAGISTGAFVYWAMIGLGNLVSIGTGAVVARRIGEGKREEAERVAYQGLLASLLVSLVFTLVFWLIAPWIFRVLMHASDEVTQEGLPYLQVVLLSTPVVFLSITATQIFQSLGDTAKPMWLMIVALVITAFVDYALMLGRLGFPSIGVRGAGAAIIASRGVFCAAAIWILFSKRFDSFIVRSHGTPWMDWPLFRRVTAIGLPTAFEGVLFPVVYMLLTRYTTAHGTAEVAALRVGHTLEGLTFFGALGMGIAMRPLVGQNLGAGHVERAARAPWIGFALIAAPILAYSALLVLAPERVVAYMTGDAAVVEAGARYLRIVGWSQIFMALELVFVGAFSGAGETLVPMLIVVPVTLARWPIAHYTQEWGIGIEGVWWAISGTSIAKGILITAAFMRGRWKTRVV